MGVQAKCRNINFPEDVMMCDTILTYQQSERD